MNPKIRPNPSPALKVGLIGLGSMGSFVAREILEGRVPGVQLLAAADVKAPSPELLREMETHSVPWVQSFEALAPYPLELVIECANQKVVKECADFNATLEVPRPELKAISSAILNRLPVIDFNIEDIPIEEGIALLYQRKEAFNGRR